MFFKKKTKKKNNTNYVNKETIIWALSQNVVIHFMEIILGDYRDGPGFNNRINVDVFFKTNTDLQKYEENGFIFKLKTEIIRLLKEIVSTQDKQIEFYFDSHENIELECNGNYLRYTYNRNQTNI